MAPMADVGSGSLAEAIAAVRRELIEAMGAGENEVLRFEVGPVEVEFMVQVAREADGRLGLKVLSVGGGVTDTRTHRVHVTLKPIEPPTGGPIHIRDRLQSGER